MVCRDDGQRWQAKIDLFAKYKKQQKKKKRNKWIWNETRNEVANRGALCSYIMI